MDAMLGWDRQVTDARFDPTLPNMNDLDFLMRLYARSTGSFHIGEALHLYVKQPTSLSNGAGMTERMIAAKTLIRQRLAAGYYRFADPGAAALGATAGRGGLGRWAPAWMVAVALAMSPLNRASVACRALSMHCSISSRSLIGGLRST